MKNKKMLQKVLYGLSLLALVYTGYVLFYTYDSVTQYYTAYGSSAPVSQIVNNFHPASPLRKATARCLR